MSFDHATLARAVAGQGRVARVVVARTEGSAPREAGAAMLIWPGGQSGTIGGGALELEATKWALDALADGVLGQLRRVPLGPAIGQCCGGSVTLLCEIFDAAALGRMPEQVFARNVSGPPQPPLPVQRRLSLARNTGLPPQTEFLHGWMIEPISPTPAALWVYGAGHVGRALVRTIAPLPDFAITWVDNHGDRFPDIIPKNVTPLVAENPAGAVRYAPRDAHHIIMTYSHALDLELCHRLIAHGFASAGLIGSATKWARFRKRLSQLGDSAAQISRIRCPIGRPELGKHPQAIAVGVAATLLSHEPFATARKGIAG